MGIALGPEGEFEKKRLHRLVKLQQSDRSFFLLACHSYIESWLRQRLHMWEDEYSFEDLIFKFKINLIEDFRNFPRELSVLQNLRMKEKTALAVKHSFIEITAEEAAAAAYRLLQFCSLANIHSEQELQLIRSALTRWENRSLIEEDELTVLSQKLSKTLKENKDLITELEQLRAYRLDAERYKRQIAELECQIKSLKGQNYGGQADELVKQMNAAKLKKEENSNNLLKLTPSAHYLKSLVRLTSYTRTRLDFERDVTKLTPEQQRVLDSISLSDDFLVKGGAGTGKTLVLIKALEKSIMRRHAELSFDEEPFTARMLTYNRTLAKYDRYIAEILDQNSSEAEISTVDKFLYDQLKQINENYRIVFDDSYAHDLIAELNNLDFISNQELVNEIEGFINACSITKDNYIKSGRGLSKSEREAVWQIRQSAVEKMKNNAAFTKNYSRIIIIDYLINHPEDKTLKDTDFSFIDEVQDLPAVDIMAVKACTKRAVIMAGDADQSIYQSGFSFKQAGIDIRGTTRILRKNFRNTFEIQNLAEQYRLLSDDAEADNKPEAFRTGPPPELYRGSNNDELLSMIASRVKIFTEDLSYDAENICILVPSSRDIEALQEKLADSGYKSADLRNENFSFRDEGVIRISTMHSSKGLDFPVVLLYLHKLPQTSAAAGPAQKAKMSRNLIYVSMTRAMDQLNVFTQSSEQSPEITDLVGLFS